MQTCGMYNGAGKFTKDHGIPTKSGVSGGLMTVIRGIGMIEKLNKIYLNFNLFYKDQKKNDLQIRSHQSLVWTVIAGITAAASGDLESILRLHVRGLDLNIGDYD